MYTEPPGDDTGLVACADRRFANCRRLSATVVAHDTTVSKYQMIIGCTHAQLTEWLTNPKDLRLDVHRQRLSVASTTYGPAQTARARPGSLPTSRLLTVFLVVDNGRK